MQLEKILYTAEVTSKGGRDGHSRSPDGKIEFKMAKPTAMGGKEDGYNPEQLFAAGYSACFLGAMKFVAGNEKIELPEDVAITAHVSLGTIPGGFGIAVELKIAIPGMDRAAAQALVEKTHRVCPYSNATRGNIVLTNTIL